MDPLFTTDQEEYDAFNRRRHEPQLSCKVRAIFLLIDGNCYLGIDAGSTTTKVALVGEDGTSAYTRFYDNNNGSPLKTAIRSQ